MAKKKYLKVLLWLVSILLTPIIICLIVMKMPINVNTRNDEDIFKQNNQTYSYSILYGGKEFTDAKSGNVFSSLEESGIESEIPLGYSMDTGEKHRFISNAHEGYGLEYIYDGNIKKIYPRKYKRIIDYIDPIEYLLIGDYYLLIIDQSSSSSHERLLKNSPIKMPEMKRENIEKIEQCIGIPDYSYSSENCEKFIDDLKSEHDRYIVQRKDIFDSDFIEKLADEFRRKGHIDGIVDAASEENKQIIKEAQAKVDSDPENEYKVKVYYKIYFKDEKFPFRLVLTKTTWDRDKLIP